LSELDDFVRRAHNFEQEAHGILGIVDTAPSRVITIKSQRDKLGKMSIDQDELMDEAFTACERGLYRSAIVMSWAAFFDALVEKLFSDGFVKLHALRTKWSHLTTPDDLQEAHTEHAILTAAADLKLLGKSESKVAFGLLSRRNQCAHPTPYKAGLNDALGFISDMLTNIENVAKKPY
jgi:hypothetical protein